ncbi:NAD(P)H-hydrate dehydratase [Jiulongibacter sp. NS-SX5]|uniref:NAD(P)H-hydrate dehydratase n=1 Tax=Jiulongibacter sp. NS-SX5 TaxID=3463854 RepID=UPI004058B0CA
MKILSAQQIREADEYTIKHEPIVSSELMERAASKCTEWLRKKFDIQNSYQIFCGVGNNGGDGLVIARQLFQKGFDVQVYQIAFSSKKSKDFILNEKRLQEIDIKYKIVKRPSDLPAIKKNKNIVIDAIFGSGLNQPVRGLAADAIRYLNDESNFTVSIDLPSGLFPEDNEKNNPGLIINAKHTLTFELPKLALLFPANGKYVGEWHLLSIGLHQGYIKEAETSNFYITEKLIQPLFSPRRKYTHKGVFGHAVIVAGSTGKMGAATLAVKAALRSGAGLVTAHIPNSGLSIMQTTCPEAMADINIGQNFLENQKAETNGLTLGIGPGIGKEKKTGEFLKTLLQSCETPVVLDADALNIIAETPSLKKEIPANSILTPHPKEFSRLVGTFETDNQKHQKQRELARELDCIIILKGAHTSICLPDGRIFFNSTGNPGMATGGSGDVLTGLLTGLLAQNYSPENASLLGVYLHGKAGDYASEANSAESLIAGDIIDYFGEVFKTLNNQ